MDCSVLYVGVCFILSLKNCSVLSLVNCSVLYMAVCAILSLKNCSALCLVNCSVLYLTVCSVLFLINHVLRPVHGKFVHCITSSRFPARQSVLCTYSVVFR